MCGVRWKSSVRTRTAKIQCELMGPKISFDKVLDMSREAKDLLVDHLATLSQSTIKARKVKVVLF